MTHTAPDDPDGTIAEMVVGEVIENDVAVIPPKLTEVTPVKLVPVMVTNTPVSAAVGLKEVIVVNLFLKIEIVLELVFADTISGFSSPSKSPIEVQKDCEVIL
jgi:hypothetical protein